MCYSHTETDVERKIKLHGNNNDLLIIYLIIYLELNYKRTSMARTHLEP